MATNTGEQHLDVVVRCRSIPDLVRLVGYLQANEYPFDLQSENSRELGQHTQDSTRNANTVSSVRVDPHRGTGSTHGAACIPGTVTPSHVRPSVSSI